MDYGTSSYAGSNYGGAKGGSDAPKGRRYSIEEDATAGWITEVLATAPAKSTNATGFEEHEPAAYRVEKPRGQSACRGCPNITLIIFNIIFLLCGLGIVTLAVIAMKDSSWQNVCSDCKNAFYGVIGLGSLIALVSILGLVGTCASKCLLRTYSAFMILFMLLVATGMVFVILLDKGKFTSEFGNVWRSAVNSDKNAICKMQDSFSCSGWTACCGPNVEDCDKTKPVEKECPVVCNPLIYQDSTKTCYTAVHSYINDKMPLMVGAIAGVLLLVIVCNNSSFVYLI